MAERRPKRTSIEEWLLRWRTVNPDTDCWEWQRTKYGRGYGTIKTRNGMTPVHRVAWELWRGPIPDGLCVLHHCDNPPCFNPDHLFTGTDADNTADKYAKGRENIQRGKNHHSYRHPERVPRGEQTGRAILTAAQVRAIRADTRTLDALAAAYGITKSGIAHIKARRTWKHVP